MAQAPRKGVSLHIGLDSVDPAHYGGWSGPLMACEADANDMANLANQQGFSHSKLLTANATRDAVISGIKSAAGQLASGDIFFLSYSGHGGQVPDAGGDETDLQDETWCLYDGQLIDDELYELWSAFDEGVRIIVLSDSCHSGTVVRQAYDALVASGAGAAPVSMASHQPVYRAMPDDAAFQTYQNNRGFYDAVAAAIPEKPTPHKANVQLISGCQDNQLSLDGTFNGLFTGTLKRVWSNGNFNGDYTAFHAAILARMPPTQSPNHYLLHPVDRAFVDQKPFAI